MSELFVRDFQLYTLQKAHFFMDIRKFSYKSVFYYIH